MNEEQEVSEAEFKDKDMVEQSSDVPPMPSQPVKTEAEVPVVNGTQVNQVRYLDYGEIRVVFEASTGAVLGVMPAKKAKKVK